MGVNRTDAGLLGNGIYFGKAADTATQYSTFGERGSGFFLAATVALGNVKQFISHQIGLASPPHGYHSVHGVARRADPSSVFEGKFVPLQL